MKIRRLIRLIHRDIGYVAFALVIIYSISGIAVNHVNDWNPNYIIEKDTLSLPVKSDSLQTSEILVSSLIKSAGIADSAKSYFRSSPSSIDIFFENKTLSADYRKRLLILETVKSRTIFRETKFLHLNNPKKLWTWVADLFGLSLIILAGTGIFMIKGKNGIKGRGKWLTLIGIIIPLLFLFLYF
ncbi:MAG: hypothetical protein R3250_01825 [Melioribacteraceae bacterium]|nr:hypothetical protein [Melioribacteraceae bacterium]